MNTWNLDELTQIAEKDDLHIAPFREDGKTYGTPTWIWSVRVGDDLYVRAYNGTRSRWYQSALSQKAGLIKAAGLTKKVAFESASEEVKDEVDNAYKAKYMHSPYLDAMIGERARAATICIAPREVG